MSVFTLPNLRLFRPRRIDASPTANLHRNDSPLSGAGTDVSFPGDRHRWRFEYGNNYTADERKAQRAFWNRFRGGTHLLRVWFVAEPEPRGTMRSATVSAAVFEGETQIVLVGSSGVTLFPGDWVGIPLANGKSQLIEVGEVSGTGTITVQSNAPFRWDVNEGASAVFVRPTADFRIVSPPVIPHEPVVSSGFAVDLEEFLG